MAPNLSKEINQVATDAAPKPKVTLPELRRAIPKEAFEKSLPKSLFYMAFDYSMIAISFIAIYSLTHSALWTSLPWIAKAIASVVYWNVAGFFLWCIFVVGHDCGHGTFSNNKLLNDVIGHITHGSLLVPFYPWQLSHRRHHMYHNHVEKDYSYMWFPEDVLNRPERHLARLFHNNALVSFFMPFYGWFIYLFFGIDDGNHYLPIPTDRLWKDTPITESLKCLTSTVVVLFYATIIYQLFDGNLFNIIYYYLAPLTMFSWWLITVTYLQHHHPDSIVYDDKDWDFTISALETVDREYGCGIDTLHHHITDGHVAHHLFYSLIPHYNLPIATKAIKDYLKENNAMELYRFEKTHDFPIRVHSYLMTHGFRARRATPVEAPMDDDEKKKMNNKNKSE